METLQQQYSRPFLFALILHAIILTALCIELNFPSQPRLAGENKSVQIVKAVAINQNKVEEEMNRLAEERQQKQAKEEARQQKLAQQAQKALQQRKTEQAKLRHAQEELKRAEKQRVAEKVAAEKQMQKIKQQQEAENKRLVKIKQEHAAAEAEQKLAEKQKKAQELAEKQKAVADQHKKDLEHQVQEEANSAENQREIDKYKALVINAIQNNWNYPENVSEDMTCLLQIKLGPGGVVLSVAIVRSSGNTLLDRSAEVAVYKASPLPVPSDPNLFDKFRTLNLKVRPQGKVSG